MNEKAVGAYFDSSVLAKTYVKESGSDRSRQLVRSRSVMTSSIAGVEVSSAFRRKLASGSIDEKFHTAIMKRFAQNRRKFRFVEMTSTVLARAEQYVTDFDVRALDAIHLASAMVVRDRFARNLPFITADSRQRDVAEQLGLEVIWIE
jgi:predicted nucleic acid-binding protein